MMCAALKEDKQTEMEMEIEFSMDSTIHQTLFQYFRKMHDRVSRISPCINFKAEEMESRRSLYGASLQGSSSQLIRQFVTFNRLAMSNSASITFQIQGCLVVIHASGRQKQRGKNLCIFVQIKVQNHIV
ncbi:hypothetical protein GQ457_05G023510 [Hibiscus cannabinus]